MRVLITRPQDDAQRLAQRLHAQGHACHLAPLLQITPTEAELPPLGDVRGLAFTSANGVRALAAKLTHADAARWRALPAYAVGPQTYAAAAQAGFANLTEASGDVESLAEQIASHIDRSMQGSIVHIAGTHLAGNLQALLAAHSIRVEKCVLYEALAASQFDAPTQAAMRDHGFECVVIYSQRSAHIYVALMAQIEAAMPFKPVAFCLSPAIAEILQAAGFATETAAAPHEDAMLALLQNFAE